MIAYTRPFTRNKPYGPLDRKWGKFDDPGLQKLHELMIKTRHTLIAHSDKLYCKVQVIPKGTSHIPGMPPNKKIAMDMFPRIEILCLNLGGRLDKEMFDLLDKLYGDRDLPPKPFDLL